MQQNIRDLEFDKNYLVAVSGGSDSMALLDLLYQAGHTLFVAHINYKMRASADRDQAIVETYCMARNIPFYVQTRDQEPKGNFQDWARRYRYLFFQKVYLKHGCHALLTAHHLQDFLETYLMKEERSSLSKHVGIAATTVIKNMQVIRPLLSFHKQELLDYCHDHQIAYGVDETNFDRRYRRNAIRLQYLDHLSKKEVEKLYQKTLFQQKKQEEFFFKVSLLYQQLVENNCFDFTKLTHYDLPTQRQFLYQFLVANTIKPSQKITAAFVSNLLTSLGSDKPNLSIPLGTRQLVKSYGQVRLMTTQTLQDYAYMIRDEQPYLTPYFEYQGKEGDEFSVSFADFPLTIRNYQTSDKIKINDHHTLLRRFFINKKIPLHLRKKIPIVCNQAQEIIFIPYLYTNKDGNLLQTSRIVLKLRALL